MKTTTKILQVELGLHEAVNSYYHRIFSNNYNIFENIHFSKLNEL